MKLEFKVNEVEKELKIKFKNKNLLEQAFTHSSYANENRVMSNERLEFLGDSVLGLVITELIFKQTKMNEGNLSKLRALIVSEVPLSQVITKLNIERFMLKGVGEQKNKNVSNATKCDLYEAIVGAIYLDKGFDAAQAFIKSTLSEKIKEVFKVDDLEDAKTRLQETIPHDTIKYVTEQINSIEEIMFKAVVMINNIACGEGLGSNKRIAEQNAARAALKRIKEI